MFNLKAFNGGASGSAVQFSTGAKSTRLPVATTYSTRKLNSLNKTAEDGSRTSSGGRGKGDVSWWERNDSGLSKTESEEYIIAPGNGKTGRNVPLQIWESRRVDVETGSVVEEEGRERDLKSEQVRIYDGVGKGRRGEFESSVKIEAGKSVLAV